MTRRKAVVAVSVEWRGVSDFRARLESMVMEKRAVTELAATAACELVKRDTVDMLMQREHAKGTPTPSAPGQPPAMITGKLKASVRVEPPRHISATRVEGRVGPSTVYSRIQELGGTAGHGAHLPARPYLKPAVEEALPEIAGIFAAMWSAGGIGVSRA